MTKYAISACYHASTVGYVEFPDGKTWDDVAEWYIKWDSLHVNFTGDTEWHEFMLGSDTMEVVDWKRPTSATVYPTDEGGDVDYDEELAEI